MHQWPIAFVFETLFEVHNLSVCFLILTLIAINNLRNGAIQST